MNVSKSMTTIGSPQTEQVALRISPEAQQILILGRQRDWDFAILGQAPMPREAVRLGEWLIVPAHQDTSPVPTRALERVQAIFAAGLRPKGFVVVHEAPLLLQAPTQTDVETSQSISMPDLAPALKVAGSVLGVLGTVAVAASGLAVLSVAAIALGAIMVIPAVFAVGAAVLDPMLITVTEDDIWIEIDHWWN